MDDNVFAAFRTILSVPLGFNDETEYLIAKQRVAEAASLIAQAGGLAEEYEAAWRSILETLSDPHFWQYVKSQQERR